MFEGDDALGEARFQPRPFRRRDDAGSRSVGMIRSVAWLSFINGEGDALVQEALLAGLLSAREFLQRQGESANPARHKTGAPCRRARTFRQRRGPARIWRKAHPSRVGAAARGGDNIGAAEILRVGKTLLLHERTVTFPRQFRQGGAAKAP